MRHAVELLDELGVPNEHRIVSAHRTPEMMAEFARTASERGPGGNHRRGGRRGPFAWNDRGAHLASRPRVPIQSHALHGMDSLLSIAQMPAGVPVGTLAIGTAGATNAALLAASILALGDEKIREKLEAFRKRQTDAVLTQRVP